MKPRQLTNLSIAAALAAMLTAGAAATQSSQAQTNQPETEQPSFLAPVLTPVLAEAQRIGQHAAALATAADDRLRSARDAVTDYVHRQAAAAPRMRGVHLLAAGPSEHADGQHLESDLRWLPVADVELPEHLILLIHGLDEPGRVWDDLAPALHDAGLNVARFDYPNDQAITDSADMLSAALHDLHARGVRSIDLVGHSMGGLVARDLLTRDDHYAGTANGHDALPDVTRFVMLGTPNHGSSWARLQCLSDAAEQVDRWMSDPRFDPRHLLGFLADGRGEAAADLRPGSEFLRDLNARPLPKGIAITHIVALIDTAADERCADSAAAPILSRQHAAEIRRAFARRLGDGVVSLESSQLDGVDDVIIVAGTHRGAVRASRLETALRWALRRPQDEPPAIAPVLERLTPDP